MNTTEKNRNKLLKTLATSILIIVGLSVWSIVLGNAIISWLLGFSSSFLSMTHMLVYYKKI